MSKKKSTNTATGKSTTTTFCGPDGLSPVDPPQQPVEFTGGTGTSNNINYTTDKAPAPVKRRGRARSYSLDKVTNVNKAMFRITHQKVSILSLEGWYNKLKQANAAEHAANSFAKYTLADRIIGNEIYAAAMQMTIARCVDYGKTTEEAAELISKAMEKKTTSLIIG